MCEWGCSCRLVLALSYSSSDQGFWSRRNRALGVLGVFGSILGEAPLLVLGVATTAGMMATGHVTARPVTGETNVTGVASVVT